MRFRRDEDAEGGTRPAQAARLARVRAEQAVQRWYSAKMTLMGVTFPVYAAEHWPARINGQGSSGDDLTHLTIAHAESLDDSGFVRRPRIEVTTSIDPPSAGVSRRSLEKRSPLESKLTRAGSPPKVFLMPALTLYSRAARRRRVAASHEAPVSETEIMIDGSLEQFVTVGTPNARWVAVRRHHDVTITIKAREIDPASLVIDPIANLTARLLGPRPIEP